LGVLGVQREWLRRSRTHLVDLTVLVAVSTDAEDALIHLAVAVVVQTIAGLLLREDFTDAIAPKPIEIAGALPHLTHADVREVWVRSIAELHGAL
jgi:hypothetical protein